MISQQKQRLRDSIRPLLSALSAEEREKASAQIRFSLHSLEPWKSARVIALFHPLPTEPDCLPMDLAGKIFCFPRVEGDHLRFHAVASHQELVRGKWGILESDPERHPPVDPGEISCIVVPGLAFDYEGHRLGRGKGFYDRALSGLDASAVKIGVCFACQMVGAIPHEAHDIRMDQVLSA